MLLKLNAAFRRAAMAVLNAKAHLLGQPPELNPNDPAFVRDPYPFYRRLRERDPVHYHPLGIWLVTRYTDALTVWSDPRFAHPPYADDVMRDGQVDPLELMRSKLLVSRNPPDHTRLRRIFADIFTKRFIDSWRSRIEEVTRELLGRTSNAETIDIVKDLAEPLPAMVISEIIGLPPQDREMLMEWSGPVVTSIGVAPTPAERRLGSEAGQRLAEYFQVKIQERREKPGQDLISKLIAVQAEDGNISDDEIVANTILVFIAGHETTVSLLGCGMLSLLRNPAELLKLRANPSLMGKAIEELLRYEAPAQFFGRMAMEDLSLGAKRIKKGQTVFIVVGAVNRDPEQFPEPERLNIERTGNSHLTFGHGIHACIGQYLARVEGSIAFSVLLQHFPKLRLAADPEWSKSLGGRSLTSLRLRVD